MTSVRLPQSSSLAHFTDQKSFRDSEQRNCAFFLSQFSLAEGRPVPQHFVREGNEGRLVVEVASKLPGDRNSGSVVLIWGVRMNRKVVGWSQESYIPSVNPPLTPVPSRPNRVPDLDVRRIRHICRAGVEYGCGSIRLGCSVFTGDVPALGYSSHWSRGLWWFSGKGNIFGLSAGRTEMGKAPSGSSNPSTSCNTEP
ncbi:hypothetical protein B0H11DRAFT_1945261 [Mycena galericulata]|nr:hypothetical protein B0H11DRAFT_1945261 [Mycena galericulata]